VAAGIAIQLTLVVTGIVVARTLGPENRGHLALLTLVAAILWTVGPLGIPAALGYTVARVPDRAADIIRRLSRAAAVRGIAATVMSAVLLALLTAGRPGYVQAGALVVLVVVPSVIVQQYGLSVLQGLRCFTAFNVLRVVPNAAFAVSATALVLANRGGFIEIALAWGISRSVFAPVTLVTARRRADAAQTGDGEIPSTSWMLRFGRRAFFGSSPPVETYRLDQSVVALFLPPVALGIYVVALAFTNLPRFIARSVGAVASPTAASRSSRDHARRTMWRFFWIGIPLYLPVIAGLWLLAPELVRFFFGEEFADAAPITRLLLVAVALYCGRRVLTDAARGAGYPGVGSVAEIVALVSVIPLFGAFVPLWGTRGVAYALIGSSAIAFGVLLVGLLRPSARRGEPGPGWFETVPHGGAPDASGDPTRQSAGEPTSFSA
jgi:O-antigen/teichoic acid export membrane protein